MFIFEKRMNLKIINRTCLAICTLLLVACSRENWLDVKPRGVIIPTKVSDYRLLLDQTWHGKISRSLTAGYANVDLMSDDFEFTGGSVSVLDDKKTNAYTWNDNIYAPNDGDPDWNTLYGHIYVANLVEEEIMNATEGSMDEKHQLLAEAKLHRAFAYFTLVNLYGLHYTASTAETNTAVPLRSGTEIDGVSFPRASVKKIYDQVLTDIQTALPHLPPMPPSNALKHRPSAAAAYALLARVYLFMGEYEMARNAADESLKRHHQLLNYNEIPDHSSTFPLIYLPRFPDDNELLWRKESLNIYEFLPVAPDLFASYEPGDQRLRYFGPIATLFHIPDTEEQYAMAYAHFTNFRYVGVSVSEMYLTRAESQARLGNHEAAIADLNTLRAHRLSAESYRPLANMDAAAALERVKLERRLELVGNGIRFFDLKRYNAHDNAGITLTRNLNNRTYTLPAGSKNWALPIALKNITEVPELGPNLRD